MTVSLHGSQLSCTEERCGGCGEMLGKVWESYGVRKIKENEEKSVGGCRKRLAVGVPKCVGCGGSVGDKCWKVC